MPSEKPVVRLRGLVREFGDVRALAGVDLDVAQGEVVALLGHNGAGKTTTLRHLTGVLAPSAGLVRVFGLDPVADGVPIRQRTGVLPADASVDDTLSGRDNLRFVADLWGVDPCERTSRGNALLERFELSHRADDPAGTYSTGMRQRLALARVLMHEPELLLLDEPTIALDPLAARQVREIIARLAGDEQRTVVVCTHNLDEAQRICDRVVILEHGAVIADGTVAELVHDLDSGVLLLEVEPHASPAALAVLTGRGHAVQTPAPGELAVSAAGRQHVPGILSALVAAGVPVYAVQPRAPSLEDVYIALHAAGVRP